MKFKITEGINRTSGSPIFYVYEWANDRWAYAYGSSKEQDARDYVERAMNPVAEKVIAEIKG